MEVLPLHKHKELTDACADILNAYWPRSKGAREHSLRQSCDHLPVCLAFVTKESSKLLVLGFSKISAVQGIKDACLVESVIVRDGDRGKGLGRVLMNLTEEYAKKLGIQTVYLNTLDKEGFYSKLGYVRCKPVVSLGANAHRIPEGMLKKLLGTSDTSILNPNGTTHQTADTEQKAQENGHENISIVAPPAFDSDKPESGLPLSITSSPTAPPPPPLPSKGSSSSAPVNDSRIINRLDPNCVTWMKKDLSVF